jgi:microcystin-dependent protein
MPSHNHEINDPGHSHNLMMHVNGNENGKDLYTIATHQISEIKTVTATTGISIKSAGSNQPHENRPPYYVLAFIIRVK